MCIDGLDGQGKKLNLTSIGFRCQLKDCVQGNLDVGQLLVCLVQKVSQDGSQDCLVSDNQNVLLTLQLHNHRFQAENQVGI